MNINDSNGDHLGPVSFTPGLFQLMVWLGGLGPGGLDSWDPFIKGIGILRGTRAPRVCVGQLREEVQRLHYEAADRLTLRSNLRPRHVFLITNNAVLVMCRAGLRQLEWHMEQYHRGV